MDMIHNVILGFLFFTGLIFFVINERKNIKAWLLYAVANAEKNIGSKLGQIKLRQVYNEFICKFPLVSKILPFWLFERMIDGALKELKELIEKNDSIKKYLDGSK